MNCWEFKQCEQGPNGVKVKELGYCPTATNTSLNGINGGENAGRCCWRMSMRFNFYNGQGAYAKIFDCLECAFLKEVEKEEGDNFRFLI
ncbi:MAG: two-CW domain-containing protein [Thermodesulfobacteriota bacterium]